MTNNQIVAKKLLDNVGTTSPSHVIVVSISDKSLNVAWSNISYEMLTYMQCQLEMEIKNKIEIHNKESNG